MISPYSAKGKRMSDPGLHTGQDSVVVGVTGASGGAYAVALLRELGQRSVPVDLVASSQGMEMLHREEDFPLAGQLLDHLRARGIDTDSFRLHDNHNLAAGPASGSYRARAMVICPCSTKTLSAVAQGASRSLIERAAEVMLKEKRPLILVVREAPYSLVQIENMRAAALAGAVILPASPAFYHRPRTVGDLVDFIVARILDHLRLPHNLIPPWDG